MRVAVIGTGVVGRTLTDGFRRIGHDVVVGTRDIAETRARAEWAEEAALVTFADAGAGADLVVNATGGGVSAQALGQVDLDGTVLLDVANPLDFSGGFPPTLTVKDTDSLAEQLQRAFPQSRVVKALNTVNASVMVDPGALPEPTTMFLAGDDADARTLVRGLLTDLGWADIVEFETLDAARGMEMWLPMWVRLMGALGTPSFNLKLVR